MSAVPRVGLVGCGAWGQHILRDLLSLPCEVAVVARSQESQQRARSVGARLIVPDLSALPPVNGIVVATLTSTHMQVIEALLDRRVPLFVEKPLCVRRQDAERLARVGGDRIFVMDKWRYHPGVELLRDIARSGELGPVLGLRSVRGQWGDRQPDVDTSWHLAPHDLAIIVEVFGELPPARFAVAEVVNAKCRTLIGVLGREPWAVIEVTSRMEVWRRELRLHCRDGVAALSEAYATHVTIAREGPGRSDRLEDKRPLQADMPLLKELTAFIAYLNGGPPPRSDITTAVAIVAALEELRLLAGLPHS